ncbi:MAG: YiiX/YebB-like N1pC/P60 family cysteine hydrolase [Leptospirales bacterium]
MKLLKQKSFALLVFTAVLFTVLYGYQKNGNRTNVINNIIKEGDIIFLASNSARAKAIQIASKSPYSHVGVVIRTGKSLMVFEAVQPVRFTSLNKFMARGNLVLVKRLKNDNVMTDNKTKKFRALASNWAGKNYDGTYRWSDSRMYCSELVWKLYDRAFGIKLASLRRLSDYSLDHPVVRAALKRVYGKSIPYKQTVIAPGDLANSELLRVVDL